jgi:hypothetical protein
VGSINRIVRSRRIAGGSVADQLPNGCDDQGHIGDSTWIGQPGQFALGAQSQAGQPKDPPTLSHHGRPTQPRRADPPLATSLRLRLPSLRSRLRLEPRSMSQLHPPFPGSPLCCHCHFLGLAPMSKSELATSVSSVPDADCTSPLAKLPTSVLESVCAPCQYFSWAKVRCTVTEAVGRPASTLQ